MDDPRRLARLSPKMLAVRELDLQGLSPKEIGSRLRLSEFAVRIFLQDIESRLNPLPEDKET